MAEEPINFRPLRVVQSVRGMDRIQRQRDLVYKSLPSATHHMDIYRPCALSREAYPGGDPRPRRRPTRVVEGHQGLGPVCVVGRTARRIRPRRDYLQPPSTEGWTRIADAASDVEDLVALVRVRATTWNIDPDRLAIWVASAGGFLGADVALTNRPAVRCLVLYYGLMTPSPAAGADMERYSTPARIGKDGPSIFVARAGLDRPGLNATLDRFTDAALKAGLDLEVHNHANGRHAFDILDPSPRSAEIIARSVEFLKSRLAS